MFLNVKTNKRLTFVDVKKFLKSSLCAFVSLVSLKACLSSVAALPSAASRSMPRVDLMLAGEIMKFPGICSAAAFRRSRSKWWNLLGWKGVPAGPEGCGYRLGVRDSGFVGRCDSVVGMEKMATTAKGIYHK